MGAGYEAQWDAAWFAEKAAQCIRLSRGSTQKDVIEALTAMAKDFIAQSELAARLQRGGDGPAR